MSAAMQVAQLVGTAAAKSFFRAVIDSNFDKKTASLLKSKFLGDAVDYFPEFEAINARLGAIESLISDLQKDSIYQIYISKRTDLLALFGGVSSATPETEMTANQAIANTNGVFDILRQMRVSLFVPTPNQPSPIRRFAELLLNNGDDVSSFVAKMEALGLDFFLLLTAAQVADENAHNILGDKSKKKDVESIQSFWDADRTSFDNLMGPARNLESFIRGLDKTSIIIRHEMSGNFLTAKANGSPKSLEGVTDLYKPHWIDPAVHPGAPIESVHGLPQVFPFPRADGSSFTYCVNLFHTTVVDCKASTSAFKFTAEDADQRWVVEVAPQKDRLRLRFRNTKAGKYLAGILDGSVFLSTNEDAIWWKPILDKNDLDRGPDVHGGDLRILLVHESAGANALDATATAVYANNRRADFSNPAMKWRLVDYTAIPLGQALRAETSIKSPSGEIEFGLSNDHIYLSKNGKVYWSEYYKWDKNVILLKHGKGIDAAYMQDDGNFVVYDKSKHPVWSSGTDNVAAGGQARVHNDGRLVITDKEGKLVWQRG